MYGFLDVKTHPTVEPGPIIPLPDSSCQGVPAPFDMANKTPPSTGISATLIQVVMERAVLRLRIDASTKSVAEDKVEDN